MAPTVIERISSRSGLPFAAVALVAAAILAVPWLILLVPDAAQSLLSSTMNRSMGAIRGPQDVLYWGLLFVFLCYVIFAMRYMRARVLETQVRVAPLTPGSADALERAFRPAAWIWPALATSVVLHLVYAWSAFFGAGHEIASGDAPLFLLDIVVNIARTFVIVEFAWLYFGAVAGLAAVCRRPLELLPYYSDGLLGTRPLGLLSLSLAATFFLGYALGLPLVILGYSDPYELAAGGAIFIVGLVLFFLPLVSVHNQMAEEKQGELDFLHRRYTHLFTVSRRQPDEDEHPGTLADVTAAIGWLASERRIQAIRTWPFDVDILARLATSFVVPVVLTVVGREAILLVLGL